MSFYEYLPHEYSYACFLAYIYDLHHYDSTIFYMVSKRYPRDVDVDCASASDSEICEEDGSDDDEVLSVSSQNLEFSTSQNSILFGSFENPIIPVSSTSIVPVFDGFSIMVGEISCFLGDACSNNGDSAITSSEEDKQSKDDETQFVISKASKKSKNQSVQAFSSMIKRQHDDIVDRFRMITTARKVRSFLIRYCIRQEALLIFLQHAYAAQITYSISVVHFR